MADNNNTQKPQASSSGAISVKTKSATGNRRPPKKDVKKRWMMFGGAAIVFLVVAGTLMSGKPPAPVQQKKDNMVDVTPKGVTEKAWQSQSQGDIDALKASVAALKQAQAAKDKEIEDLKKGQTPGSGAGNLPGSALPLPPVPGGKSNLSALPPPPPPIPVKSDGSAIKSGSGEGPISGQGDATPKAVVLTPPEIKGETPSNLVKARTKYTKNAYAGYLPPSFVQVTLLHGLDAGTATTTQSNPQPILLRVQNNAVLPGSGRYALKTCFVQASAYGDLSAERVYARLTQLSCLDKANKTVLSEPIAGYIVDSDGKLGLRGKLVDRQGARLGKALLAGFAQGISQIVGQGMSTTTTSALGAMSTITGSQAEKAGLMGGASNATKSLADFYMQQAQSIFPVIEISAGRTGTIVISEGKSLHWHSMDTLYEKDVQPAANGQSGQ